MVCLTLVFSIIAVLFGAKYPPTPGMISLEKPIVLVFTLAMVVALFLPPLILAFFQHRAVRIFSAIYQGIIILAFLVLIPVGIYIPNIWVILIGIVGTIITIGSIMATIMVGIKNERMATQHY